MTHPDIRVLVADDDELVRECVCEMLHDIGYSVCASVASGEEAVEQTALLHPDIVLMDVCMPGMGGIEAARRIQRAGESAAVVFLTGMVEEEITREAAETGSFGYLVKPVALPQLRAMLQTAKCRSEEWHQANQATEPGRVAERAVQRFVEQTRDVGLSAATGELLAAVGSQLDAHGVFVSVLGQMDRAPHIPAQWGASPPDSAKQWLACVAALRQPCTTMLDAEEGERIWFAAAPLDALDDERGMLVAFIRSTTGFTTDAFDALVARASILSEAFSRVCAQQPLMRRMWLRSGRMP